jgi:Radical SAM superfamily
MLDLRLPAVCDFSVTNVCNAACDFCGFARDKTLIGAARYVDADAFSRALPILHRRGIRYMTLQGGEPLVDLDRDELVAALDAIGRLRKRFPVVNPQASLAEVARYVRGEQQAVPCIGGYKYFFLDWSLDIWRCEAWNEPLGSVFDLDRIPDQREPCNACMMACYRNASMLMHAAVAAADAAQAVLDGEVGSAVASLFRRSVAQSLWALIEETPKIRRLARRRKQTVANDARRADARRSNCGANA